MLGDALLRRLLLVDVVLPYHYAPFAADISEAFEPDAPPELVLGSPFLPFQQLMGVLPRLSHALPTCFAELMTDACSRSPTST